VAVLTAQHLAKSYQKRVIIRDVSLQVESGQVVGLLGPNGAGKTTCFYMIAGIVTADAGRIFIKDEQTHDLTKLAVHQRAKLGLGYLPQEASVFRKLSSADNILAILETRPNMTKDQRLHRTDELLKTFRLEHIRDSLGMALSGGERRRVEIARALASDPKFILLDLKDMGIGVLITDHNVRETLDICEHAYIAGEGKIIAQGSAAAILDNQQVRDTYLGQDFRL